MDFMKEFYLICDSNEEVKTMYHCDPVFHRCIKEISSNQGHTISSAIFLLKDLCVDRKNLVDLISKLRSK